MPKETNIQIRRGTSSQWESSNPTLALGEIALETNTSKIKVGNGSAAWNNLKYLGFDGGNLDAGSTPTTTAAPAFTPMAVLLTSGTSYTAPAGATSMKAWAVGAGHGQAYGGLGPSSARGGSIAYKTWSVSGGQSVAYSINTNPQYQNGPPSYSATGSTADTTVTFGGQTIRGVFGLTGGNPNDETFEDSGVTWLQYSGGDGLAAGGGHQTNQPGSGYYYRGGAAGGNSPSPSCGDVGYRRNVMTDVSGLKAALTLAGAKVTDDCSDPQAFGNGAMDTKFSGVLSAGLGGGAINMPAGAGAVILYFT